MEDERFDGVLMGVVQQAHGINNFYEALFGFMRRKTDFFSQEDVSRKMVNEIMEKHCKLFQEDKKRQDAIARKKAEEAAKKAKVVTPPKPAAAEKPKVEEDTGCAEVTEEEARQIELEEAAKKAGKPLPAKPAAEVKKDGEEDEENKGQLPNSSNGGNNETYNWGQSLQEVTVNIYLPDGTTSKMLNVVMTAKKCSIKIKNGATLMEGEWHKPIIVEDSPWCLETDGKNRRILQLNLTKKTGQNWWDCVLEGEPKINTQKVEPENSKLGDLDNETRSVVEKMMFDQK